MLWARSTKNFGLMKARRACPSSKYWDLPARARNMSRKKTSTVMCYIGGLLIVAGCGVASSVIAETAAQTVAEQTPQPIPPERNDRLPAGNDRLIDGLDGASYEPYKPEAIRPIQEAL